MIYILIIFAFTLCVTTLLTTYKLIKDRKNKTNDVIKTILKLTVYLLNIVSCVYIGGTVLDIMEIMSMENGIDRAQTLNYTLLSLTATPIFSAIVISLNASFALVFYKNKADKKIEEAEKEQEELNEELTSTEQELLAIIKENPEKADSILNLLK